MKINRYFIGMFAALLAAFGMQGCSDDKNVATASFINVYRNGSMLESLTLPLAASYQMIGIRSDADWTAQSDQEWLTLSNHEGYGYGADSTFYIRVDVAKNEGARRTANITFTSGDMSKVIAVAQKGSDMDPGDPFESAYAVVEKLSLGYNLGNTLDCDPDLEASSWWKPKGDLDWETVWGQPVTSQEIIDAIIERGFNIIRIPVTWWPHMDENWQVREVWMNRVQEVVDYVYKAHPEAYVILNVQHDTGARNGRTDGAGWLQASEQEYPESSEKFKSLWTQIANRFRDYEQRLLFEAFNEILDNADEWGDSKDAAAYRIVNKLEQDFVDAVRATGGNNEYRNLVVNTYGAGQSPAKLAGFEIPEDIHPNHLMASVHTYDPYNFCNDGGEWNHLMFDDECTSEIDALTERVHNRFTTIGIPYIYGEFGAIDEGKDMGERIKYAKYIVGKMRQYNTTGLWWMGLYNRRRAKWYEDELVDALFNAFNQ